MTYQVLPDRPDLAAAKIGVLISSAAIHVAVNGRITPVGGDRDITPEAWFDGLNTLSSHYSKAFTGRSGSGGNGAGNTALRGVRAQSGLKMAKKKSDYISKHGDEAFAK